MEPGKCPPVPFERKPAPFQNGKGGKMDGKRLIPIGRELRFIALVTASVLLCSLSGVGLIAIFFNRELGSGFTESFYTIRNLYTNLNAIVILAILLQLSASVTIIYLVALRYSHRISGPMYRFRIVLNEFLDGRPIERIRFRTDDFLKPLEIMLQSVISREQERKTRERKIRDLLEKEIPLDEQDRRNYMQKLKAHLHELEKENA